MKSVLPSPGDQRDTGIRWPGEDINHNDNEGDLCQLPLAPDGLLLDQGGFPHLSPQTFHFPAGGAGWRGQSKREPSPKTNVRLFIWYRRVWRLIRFRQWWQWLKFVVCIFSLKQHCPEAGGQYAGCAISWDTQFVPASKRTSSFLPYFVFWGKNKYSIEIFLFQIVEKVLLSVEKQQQKDKANHIKFISGFSLTEAFFWILEVLSKLIYISCITTETSTNSTLTSRSTC